MTYEWLQGVLAPENSEGKLSPLRTMFAGGMAGIANWIIAIPPDVLKSRLQTGKIDVTPVILQKMSKRPNVMIFIIHIYFFLTEKAPEGTYPNGVRDVFKVLMREEGVRALYRGAVPVFLR